MKKLLLLLLGAPFGFNTVAIAQNIPTPVVIERQVPLHGAFHKIQVGSNIDVLLTDGEPTSATIHGQAAAVDAMLIVVGEDGVLRLTARNQNDANRTMVTIPVGAAFQQLEVADNTRIATKGQLFVPHLAVFVTGHSKLRIRTAGVVEVREVEGLDVSVRRGGVAVVEE
jgi:Putative auto-transporter adhesin, head GIN domain